MAAHPSIRELNDAFRISGPKNPGTWFITPGVAAIGVEAVQGVIASVQNFTEFSQENDPHAEHDFGSFALAGQTIFWKIDYYDFQFEAGSADPSDPTTTQRVITIMLASEY